METKVISKFKRSEMFSLVAKQPVILKECLHHDTYFCTSIFPLCPEDKVMHKKVTSMILTTVSMRRGLTG